MMAQALGRPEIGAVLGDKYRITRVLGEGVTGVVFEAVNVRLGQRVAIKLAQPSLLAHPAVLERFIRNARAAARLRSRNSVRVIDVDMPAQGAPFVVTELLEGHDLAAEIAGGRALPVIEAVDLVLQACAAMVEAHRYGIVHRDLKPSNLFLAQEPDGARCVKVLDLGFSLTRAEALHLDSRADHVEASLYTSPEQVQSSRVVDLRSDIWSLGGILYSLLSGATPFAGSSVTEVEDAIVTRPPEPLPIAEADLPDGLEEVILKALSKNPEDRFASMQELIVALTPFSGRPVASSSPPSVRSGDALAGALSGRAVVTDLSRTSSAPPTPEAARRPRWRAAAMLTPILVAAPVLYMTQCNRSQPSANDRAATTSALSVTPTAESGGLSAQASTPGEVSEVSDAAAPAKTNPPPVQSEPSPPPAEARPEPSEVLVPQHPAKIRRKTPAPLEKAPFANVRGVGPQAPPAAKPASAPAPRVWDEDSPVPP